MSYITDIDFSRLVNHPISMPQAEIRAGETVVVSTLVLGPQKKADLTWLGLHVPRISPARRSSGLIYCSQAVTTITANGNFFIPEDLGAMIFWTSGQSDTITNYVSPTTVTVSQSRTVDPNYFEIIGSTPKIISSAMGHVYVGVYGEQFSRLNRPTGMPIFFLNLNVPGVVSLPPRSRRLLYGPDVISVAVTNNTYNVNNIEAVVTGSLKAYV